MAFNIGKYKAPDFSDVKFLTSPDCSVKAAPRDGTAPEGYHAMSIYPEYFKIKGEWLLAEESRMDCVPVYEGGRILVREFRNLKKGDLVITGRTENCEEGIYLHENGFEEDLSKDDKFMFRYGRSRESSFSRDYDELYDLLRYEKEHGYVVWVMGPAFSFDYDARNAFSKIIKGGYVDAVLAGNALGTHDLEGAYLGTALGQNIYTQKNEPNGHYNHLDTLNKVRFYGSVKRFIEEEKIGNGIIKSLEESGIPYVLAGSIRDDGPLPCVFGNVYEAQDEMRKYVSRATTVICMATMLHSIAVGNMTPSYRVMDDGTIRKVFFYCIDISEFMINKLADRGSLSSRGIVTNAQDFIVNIANGLGL